MTEKTTTQMKGGNHLKKRILGILLAVLLMLALGPTASAAELQGDTNRNGTIDVTFTVTKGPNGFFETESGEYLYLRELHVPYFDLALYGLEQYYYNPDCYTSSSGQQPGTALTAAGVVTTMHVFIYATEVFQFGEDEADAGKGLHADDLDEWVSWSQGAGSSFMSFWDHSTNLNYFLDYEYPLGHEGWGSTSDQQALHDGSHISLHRITGDAMGSFYAFMQTDDGVRDFGTVTKGDTLDLTLMRTVANMFTGSSTTFRPLPDTEVYIINADDFEGQPTYVPEDDPNQPDVKWESLDYTDEDGRITIDSSELEPGTYYISAEGYDEGSERGPSTYILKVKKPVADVRFGDVNNDGNVNSTDAVLLLKHTAGTLGAADFVEEAADVNGDELVNSTDAVLILKYTAGTISAFPVE